MEDLNVESINVVEVGEMCWYTKEIGNKQLMRDILSQYPLIQSMLA